MNQPEIINRRINIDKDFKMPDGWKFGLTFKKDKK